MKPLVRGALIGGLFGASALLAFPGLYSYVTPTPQSTEALRQEVEAAIANRRQPSLVLGERQSLPLSGLYLSLSVASAIAGVGLALHGLLGQAKATGRFALAPSSQPLEYAAPIEAPAPVAAPRQPAPQTRLTTEHPLQRLIDLLDKTKGGTDVEAVKHLMIEGSTGDGKSTFTSFLPHLIYGSWLVIDPHRKPSQWQGLPVFGGGRNYSEIARVLEVVHGLMISRYKLRDKGLDVGGVVNIVIDEFPAIAASDECKDIAPKVFSELTREARKVGMRLIILTTGIEVKTLKIEGEGSVRKNLLHIRCGSVAKDFAKADKLPVYSKIKGLDYCYLLNDELLPVPKLDNVPTNYQFQPLPAELQDLMSMPVISPEAASLNKLFALESAPNPHDSHQHKPQPEPHLSPEQSALYAYCLKKNQPLQIRDIQRASIKGLEGCNADSIREIIESLISLGIGNWDGDRFSV